MEKPEARSQKEQRQWLTGRTATYVTDTAVNVSKFLQAEQPRAVGGVIEGKALHDTSRQHFITPHKFLVPPVPRYLSYRSRINWHRARIRRWVWLLAKKDAVSIFKSLLCV